MTGIKWRVFKIFCHVFFPVDKSSGHIQTHRDNFFWNSIRIAQSGKAVLEGLEIIQLFHIINQSNCLHLFAEIAKKTKYVEIFLEHTIGKMWRVFRNTAIFFPGRYLSTELRHIIPE